MMGVVGGQNKGNPVFKVSNTVFANVWGLIFVKIVTTHFDISHIPIASPSFFITQKNSAIISDISQVLHMFFLESRIVLVPLLKLLGLFYSPKT